MRAALHDVSARRQVIGEAVQNKIAFPKACCVKGARGAPPVLAPALRFVDGARRSEDPSQPRRPRGRQPSEWSVLRLQSSNVRLPHQRNGRQILATAHFVQLDATQLHPQGGRFWPRCTKNSAQIPKQGGFPNSGLARFQTIVMHDILLKRASACGAYSVSPRGSFCAPRPKLPGRTPSHPHSRATHRRSRP